MLDHVPARPHPRVVMLLVALLALPLVGPFAIGCASPGSRGAAPAEESEGGEAEQSTGGAPSVPPGRAASESDSPTMEAAPTQDAFRDPGTPLVDGASDRVGSDVDAVAPRASLALLRQLERVEGGLATALRAGRCTDAAGIRDHICALASRVCTLAAEQPDDIILDGRCEDARQRCQSATTRVDDRCGP